MSRTQLRRRDGEARVLDVIRLTPAQSLDNIAYESCYARCTVHSIISGLVKQQRLVKIPGAGRVPNRYEVVDEPTIQYQLE